MFHATRVNIGSNRAFQKNEVAKSVSRECLPALWHYQAAQLNQPVEPDGDGGMGSV